MDSAELLVLKNALESGETKNIMGYINDNNIDERPMQVRKQLIDEFGRETMMPIFRKMQALPPDANMFANRIKVMTNRFSGTPGITEDDCDKMIESLNDAMQVVIDKKNALSG